MHKITARVYKEEYINNLKNWCLTTYFQSFFTKVSKIKMYFKIYSWTFTWIRHCIKKLKKRKSILLIIFENPLVNFIKIWTTKNSEILLPKITLSKISILLSFEVLNCDLHKWVWYKVPSVFPIGNTDCIDTAKWLLVWWHLEHYFKVINIEIGTLIGKLLVFCKLRYILQYYYQ